jgi:Mrp family chromosome partitioning ATPase
MSQPPPPHEPVSGRASAWLPLTAAFLVFLGFVGYGLLAPTTYRASALIVLKPIAERPLVLPSVPSPSQRLRDAAVDPEILLQVAHALELGSGPSGQAAAKAAVDARLEVLTPRPNTFEFSFKAATAAGAEKATNLLARHAATRATTALSPAAPDENAAREAARSKSANELAAFMALHPELGPSSPSVMPVAPKEAPDTEGSALRAERDQIRAKLAQLTDASADSDNPFGAGAAAAAEVKRMRRRMAEIEQSLASRKRAEKSAEPAPRVDPEVEREWKRLLAAVTNPTIAAGTAPDPTFTVMLSEATRPTAPIAPDRRLVAILGVIASILASAAVGVLQLLMRSRSAPVALATRYPSEWPRPPSDPPRDGSERPRPRSDPPRDGSEPPRPFSDPPHDGSEPPRPRSDPPRDGSDGSEPPRPRSDPPRTSSAPPRPPSDPPYGDHATRGPVSAKPILAIADPVVETTGGRTGSSNPPPPTQPSSGPPPAPVAAGPSQPPHVVTATGFPVPSPAPPRPSPASARPKPAREERGRLDPAARVPKGTLVGMMPLDARALDSTLLSESPERTRESNKERSSEVPSQRDADGPRSTLRPPPPDAPVEGEPKVMVGELLKSDPPATATHVSPESDDSWTGPSRAHGRARPAARRTTQMLGSPIAPVVRGSSKPPASRREAGDTPQQATTYSYVSSRPPEAQRTHLDTPPYYQTAPPGDSTQRRHPASTPQPYAPALRPPAQRPRVIKHPLRPGWRPDGAVDPRLRRALADELFPLAVEACFVVGVSAVDGAKHHKSRVAAELALALAEPRHPRVLLLEADFLGAALHRVMRIDMPLGAGFSQQLRAMGSTAPESWTVVEVSTTLHVLAEGIMRSPGLILSVQFEESIRSLRAYYDLIVLDGPDTSSEVECRALSSVIDGIVLVASASGSPDLGRATQLFPEKRYSTVVGV